jgi:hypothetical protein
MKLDFFSNLNRIDRFERRVGKGQLISDIILKSFRNKKRNKIHMFLAYWETEMCLLIVDGHTGKSINENRILSSI